MDHYQQAMEIYEQQGLVSLCKKSILYVSSLILLPLGKIYTTFIPPLPKLHKNRSASGIDAKFEISNYVEFRRLVFKRGDVPLEAFVSEVQDGDVVFDVGANIGMYSCLADQSGQDVSVIAFEPHPANLLSLENNIELNNSNIRVMDIALSDSNGESEFHAKSISERGEGIGSILRESHGSDMFTDSITIETRRGDDLISENILPAPDILKIDVEGAEMAVLEGFEKTLANKRCRVMLIEVHTPPNTKEKVKNHIEEYGYTVEILSESEHQIHLLAKL